MKKKQPPVTLLELRAAMNRLDAAMVTRVGRSGIRESKMPDKPKSELRGLQRPTDWTSLYGGVTGKCRPHDIDLWSGAVAGRTHRGIGSKDYFLTFEVKHGEGMEDSCRRSLEAEARRINSTVLIVHSRYELTEEGALDFLPTSYAVIMPDGSDVGMNTTLEDFRQRYDQWCRVPSVGVNAWL